MIEVVIVVPVRQQHQVGLRFRVGVRGYRILHLDQRPTCETFRIEGGVEPQHAGGVSIANGCHDDDFPSQQLDALILGEDAGASHGLVFPRG